MFLDIFYSEALQFLVLKLKWYHQIVAGKEIKTFKNLVMPATGYMVAFFVE